MNPHALRAAADEVAQRPRHLVADEQDGRIGTPEMILQVVLDAAGIAHAGARNDDGAAADAADRLALFDALDHVQGRSAERIFLGLFDLEFACVALEDFSCAMGKRRIEKDRSGRELPSANEDQEIVDQFLTTLDRECRNEQISSCLQGLAHLARGLGTPRLFVARQARAAPYVPSMTNTSVALGSVGSKETAPCCAARDHRRP